MKSLKRRLSVVLLSILSVFSLFVFRVSAQSFSAQFPSISIYKSLEDVVNALVSFIRPLFILTFIGMMLYAAYVWLTSQGDDTKIQKARNIIVAAIIGLSIAVFAPAISGIVASFLGVETLNLF